MNDQKPSIFPLFALTRPVTVLVGIIGFLVVGYIAFTRIPVELFPAGFVPPFLGVWVEYPNSNPQEIEEQIAQPLEEQIRTISGVRRISTESQANGCWTFIEFSQDTDMNVAYAHLSDRVERVKAEIPEDVQYIWLRKWSDDDDPILWVALIQEEAHDDPYLLVEQHIKKRLERIDGVGKVDVWGAEEKSILIHINQDLVKSYKVNLYEVITKLRSENFAISSGHVEEGSQKIFVRSVSKFKTLEDIENLPIRGPNLKLKDIAEVKYDVPERRWRNQIDGQKAITLGIFKESTANTVALGEEVENVLNTEIKTDPKLEIFRTEILFNQGDFINDSINNLKSTMIWGGIFAILILFFFLRRFRMTLIVNIAIPFSVLISLTVLYFIGWTLNIITMMGLMISIGMVVDNSIVVLENIYRKRTEGKDDHQAALWGASEVALAVTMATSTTIVVFLPLILMNDDIGFSFYMLRIGLPVIFSLMASLLVAMIFIPLAATKIVSHRQVQEPLIIVKTNQIYQRLLNWSLHNKMTTFVLILLALVSMVAVSKQVKTVEEMDGNINDFRLIFDLPANNTLDDTEKLFAAVEDTIRVKSDVYGVRTILARYSETWGMIRVFLHKPPPKDWYHVVYENVGQTLGFYKPPVMSREDVVKDVTERLPQYPGVDIRTHWRREEDKSSASVVLYGDDTTTLLALSKEVERRLNAIEDIVSIETDRERGNDEIRLQINREQAKKFGIEPGTIAGTVQYALRGFPLPKFQTQDKEISVQIQLREEDRQNLTQLKNLTFFTDSGKEIPLDAVASFTIEKGLGTIVREDGRTSLTITAQAMDEDLEKLYGQIDAAMKGFEMPYGYSWSKGRSFSRMGESGQSQQFAVILAITFVYLLMGILFESFILPLAVIMSIPLSFVGAYWILFITGTSIDLMSNIGFVILIGIVVNNAIVLIDLVNRLRQSGSPRFEAIMEAGRQRYRPVMMTAFTTIGGLLPMAIGNASLIGMPYAPMGRTIIGGLLVSTILSLIAVPWAYVIFDNMRLYFGRLIAVMRQGEARALFLYRPEKTVVDETEPR